MRRRRGRRRGRAHPRDHVHREGRGRAEARCAALPRARPARGGAGRRGPPGSRRSTASARGSCARTRSTRNRPRVPRARRAEAGAAAIDAFDRALEAFLDEGERPGAARDGRRLHAGQLRDMVRTAHAQLRSARPRPSARGRRAAGGGDASGSRSRASRRARRLGGGGERRSTARSRPGALRRRARRLAADELGDPRPSRARGQDRPQREGALQAPEATSTEGARGLRAGSARHAAGSDHALLRELLDLLRRALRAGASAQRSGARLRGPRADRARPARRARAACAGGTPSASSTSWSTSSRTPTASRTSCSTCSTATTVFRSATSSSRSTASATPTSSVPRATGRARQPGARRELTVNFRSRPEVLDAVNHAFAARRGRLRAAARRRRRPGAPPRDPCVAGDWSSTESRPRWEEALGPTTLRRRAARPAAVARRRGAAARRAGRRARDRRGGPRPGRRRAAARGTDMAFYERALRERGIPTHVVGGRGYWVPAAGRRPARILAALANPLDERGAVQRARVAARRAVARRGRADRPAARRAKRDPWWARARVPGDGAHAPTRLGDALPSADRRRAAAFVGRASRRAPAATRLSLETVIDRAPSRPATTARARAPRGRAADGQRAQAHAARARARGRQRAPTCALHRYVDEQDLSRRARARRRSRARRSTPCG